MTYVKFLLLPNICNLPLNCQKLNNKRKEAKPKRKGPLPCGRNKFKQKHEGIRSTGCEEKI